MGGRNALVLEKSCENLYQTFSRKNVGQTNMMEATCYTYFAGTPSLILSTTESMADLKRSRG